MYIIFLGLLIREPKRSEDLSSPMPYLFPNIEGSKWSPVLGLCFPAVHTSSGWHMLRARSVQPTHLTLSCRAHVCAHTCPPLLYTLHLPHISSVTHPAIPHRAPCVIHIYTHLGVTHLQAPGCFKRTSPVAWNSIFFLRFPWEHTLHGFH